MGIYITIIHACKDKWSEIKLLYGYTLCMTYKMLPKGKAVVREIWHNSSMVYRFIDKGWESHCLLKSNNHISRYHFCVLINTYTFLLIAIVFKDRS